MVLNLRFFGKESISLYLLGVYIYYTFFFMGDVVVVILALSLIHHKGETPVVIVGSSESRHIANHVKLSVLCGYF